MRRITLAMTLALVAAACGGNEGGVTVEDAWSRPVPPVSPARAVFLEITNGLDAQVTLTGATSSACAAMELHETSMNADRVMAMRPLDGGLAIAPAESATLEPGGFHLMCMEPSGATEFDVTLELTGADDITVAVVVEDR